MKPVIIAVASGKGGVGKTTFAVNAAVALASSGKRTLLVDGDLGGANVESCFGMKCPRNLDGFFTQPGKKDLGDFAAATDVPNLSIIAGSSGSPLSSNPKSSQKNALIRALGRFDCDAVVIDLGAGTGLNTLDIFNCADYAVLLVEADRLSVKNAFDFAKAALGRKIMAAFREHDVIDHLLRQTGSITELVSRILHLDIDNAVKQEIINKIDEVTVALRPILIVNRVPANFSGRINLYLMKRAYEKLHLLFNVLDGGLEEKLDAYLSSDMCPRDARTLAFVQYYSAVSASDRICNHVPDDCRASLAINRGVPLIKAYPEAESSRALSDIVARILTLIDTCEEKEAPLASL